MPDTFDAKTWLGEKGKEFNGEYAEIKKIDPTLDVQKIKAIADAIADIKKQEVNSRQLDKQEAMKLLSA